MQLSLFEEIDIRQKGIEYVVKQIIHSDAIRGYIKQAIKNTDRQELVKLFNESIRSYGFGNIDGHYWSLGVYRDKNNDLEFKITARELADIAIKIYK